MARIRTIKPEFWDSPGTARASLRARLFFIALWNWADDYGVGTANPNQLVAFAFPNDDIDTRTEFPRLRTEVSDCYDVAWYTVGGRPYYASPSWDDHQKNERRAKGKNPGPDQADSSSTEMRGSSVRIDGSSGTGTGEQGNRGTGGGEPPTPTCKRHPDGTDTPCAACKRARIEWEKTQKTIPSLPDVRRAATCVVHAEYPLPCPRCAEEREDP